MNGATLMSHRSHGADVLFCVWTMLGGCSDGLSQSSSTNDANGSNLNETSTSSETETLTEELQTDMPTQETEAESQTIETQTQGETQTPCTEAESESFEDVTAEASDSASETSGSETPSTESGGETDTGSLETTVTSKETLTGEESLSLSETAATSEDTTSSEDSESWIGWDTSTDITSEYAGRECTWYVPQEPSGSWAFLLHRSAQSRSSLAHIASRLRDEAGLLVLTCDFPLSPLAAYKYKPECIAFAEELIVNPPIPPDGGLLPERLILAGNGFGAKGVVYMAAQMLSEGYTGLAGMLLWEAAGIDDVLADLQSIIITHGRATFATLSPAHPCNQERNALPVLERLGCFVGITLESSASPVDVEGSSFSPNGPLEVCGVPVADGVALVHEFSVVWAGDMATGRITPDYYPEGSRMMELEAQGRIRPILPNFCGDGLVTADEQCDGGPCCNDTCTLRFEGIPCRFSASDCDLVEYCDGQHASCPDDAWMAEGAICSADGGTCQDGLCL